MKRLIVFLVVIFCPGFTITVLGQDQFESGNLTPNSNWNNGYGMTQMPGGSGKFLYEGTSPGTGSQYFRLWYSSGPTKYGPSGTSDIQINMNSETTLTNWNSSAGKAYYFATTNAYKYIIKSNGNNSMNVICFEIQGAVQSVSSVARSIASPTNVDVVTVTATLGAAFNTGQAAYLRYTTNGWTSSTVVPMTGSGTTYTANIPAQTGGTTVSYYVFTSGSASGVSTNLTTTPTKSDWYTININNNSGSNYSYTVTTCNVGTWLGTTSSDWNTAANWGCSIIPSSSTNVTIPSGTTYSPVISTGSTALANSITINSGATLTINGNTNLSITSGGSITNNGTFTVSSCPSATVTFLGSGTIGGTSVCTFPNLTLTGTITLNSNINVTGNFTSAAQKVNNGKTVTFNGSCAGAQTITRTGGGTEYFSAIVIDKSAGSLKLSSSPATNVILDDPMINNASGTTLSIKNAGTLDVNGQAFTIYGGGGGGSVPRSAILVDGATGGVTKTIKSSIADGYFYVRGTFKAGIAGVEVNSSNNGKLLFDNYVNVNTNIGFAPTDKTTIGYKLELLGVSAYNGGFVADINNTNSANGHPIYAIGSTLIYNNVVGVPFDRNREWDASGVGTAGVTAGYPYNVLIKGNSKVDIGINTTSGIDNRAIANDLTIEAGSTLDMNVMDQTGHHLTIGRDINFAGTLVLGHGTTVNNPYVGDILVGRNWTRSGTTSVFNPNETGTGYTASNTQTVISDVTSNIKARAVTFFGTDTSIITAPNSSTRNINGAFGGETFPYLKIDKTNATNVVTNAGTTLTVTRLLNLNKGTLSIGDSNIVIPSNLYRTAGLAPISNIANVAIQYNNNGRFIAQRFIYNQSTQRSWRFLTAPLQASDPLTINNAWQEGMVSANKSLPAATNPWPSKAGSWCGLSAWPGFGTHITGPSGIYDGTKGFDQGTNTFSIQYFDNSGATNAWVCPANTKSITLMSKPAWGLFVRGDRGFVIGDQYVPAATVILEPKGKINIGDVTTSVVTGKTNLIGNPYPSQINMTNVTIGGLTKQNFKLWDPKAFTNYTNTGKYIPFTWISGTTYAASNSPVTVWQYPGTVESSEALFVTPAGSSVVFHESDKVSERSTLNGIQSRPSIPGESEIVSFFRTGLSFESAPNAFIQIDGTLNLYNDNYNTNVDDMEDVISPIGSQTGAIRIKKDGYQLSISKEKPIDGNDTVYYNVSKLKQSKHLLSFTFEDFVPDATAVLYDLYTNDSMNIAVNNTDTTVYSFEITADAMSNRSDRFMVVFKPLNTVPVRFVNISALPHNNAVEVKWNIATEINIRSYVVERSKDGSHFEACGSVLSSGKTMYSFHDKSGYGDIVYYRIKSIDNNGAWAYSGIVKVVQNEVVSGISILQNPVVSPDKIGLVFTNVNKGQYDVRLIDNAGKILHRQTIHHAGGSAVQYLLSDKAYSKGVYHLEVSDQKSVTSLKVVL